ncbi:ty3-2 orfb [Moniliophthora roreri MCA 2997]|uniref:Ty3-2 orfb n=1 Tax=Moniliophthora roreri (strain MCA 2997) TaxID=1381753 RepID=V2WJU2_MONRO|nr:ty3-2 orfb [Moniliophthora roreri MCA 2997]
MDLITNLPLSDNFDTIMVMVDHSSMKGVIFILCTKKLNATQAAELLLKHMYKQYELPNKIISDRDPRFAANVFQETTKLLGVKHAMSTAYHPQTDGETKRTHHPGTELVLFRLTSDPSPFAAQQPSSSTDPGTLQYPPTSPSTRESSPAYCASIRIRTASPSPPPNKPNPSTSPNTTRPFNPFDIDKPDTPSTVPFLTSGKPNPAFISIQDFVHANPNILVTVGVTTYSSPPNILDLSMGR